MQNKNNIKYYYIVNFIAEVVLISGKAKIELILVHSLHYIQQNNIIYMVNFSQLVGNLLFTMVHGTRKSKGSFTPGAYML